MTITLQELSYTAANQTHLKLPGYEDSYTYGSCVDEKYRYIVKNGIGYGKGTQGNWKFYLSIHSADLQQAWELIAPHLFGTEQGISSCDICNLTYNMDTKEASNGKQIVLHTDPMQQDAHKLYSILCRIEMTLAQANIKPGDKPKSALQVSGSKYCYIRNDLHQYARVKKLVATGPSYNPYNQFNPYDWFKLEQSINGSWKFYLSIHLGDLEQASDLILPHLSDAQYDMPSYDGDDKRIVLYTDPTENDANKIHAILCRIEMTLLLANIRPGDKPKSALKILGSKYCYTRNDYEPCAAVMPTASGPSYNPYNRSNPYNWFKLSQSAILPFFKFTPIHLPDNCTSPQDTVTTEESRSNSDSISLKKGS